MARHGDNKGVEKQNLKLTEACQSRTALEGLTVHAIIHACLSRSQREVLAYFWMILAMV